MLSALAEIGLEASAVVLDPMYRAKKETDRAAYLSEMIALIEAASRVAPHLFVWGFPESVARLVDHWPANLKLEGWLTWYFKNAPYSVLEEALPSGFIKRSEQTGFRMQKPESVIEPLLKMSTKPDDLVIDPTAGSGTTAAVAIRLGRSAIIADRSAAALRVCRKRLEGEGRFVGHILHAVLFTFYY